MRHDTGIRIIRDDGITLVELVIVVSIIAALIVALGFSYQGWMGNYKAESQTKDIYTDLMNARARAMQRNQTHLAFFPSALSYGIAVDTNNNNDYDAGTDAILPTFPKTVEYQITWTGGDIIFENQGVVQPEATPIGGTLCLTISADPDYDCIVISPTRINMGKLTTQISNGGACNAANCVAK